MSTLEKAWYTRASWLILLWPVAVLFRCLAALRRQIQSASARKIITKVPVVIIGNLTVGGTGKTPVIMTLANALKASGLRPGVISRGYGGQGATYPMLVEASADSAVVGDEPALIAGQCEVPVVVDPDRRRAMEYLLEQSDVDVILSDDGLQHYRLPRDYEIAVVDGERLFGNEMTLPAGPLREPVSRLSTVDRIIVNGAAEKTHEALAQAVHMTLQAKALRNLDSGETRAFAGAPFKMGTCIQAVAALGNPQRFFTLLEQLPYAVETFSFPDHQKITLEALQAAGVDLSQPIVMTDKDAIKWPRGVTGDCWSLTVEVTLPEAFLQEFVTAVQSLQQQKQAQHSH